MKYCIQSQLFIFVIHCYMFQFNEPYSAITLQELKKKSALGSKHYWLVRCLLKRPEIQKTDFVGVVNDVLNRK